MEDPQPFRLITEPPGGPNVSVVAKSVPFESTATPPGATEIVGDERSDAVLDRPEGADRRELRPEHERAGEPVLGEFEHCRR